MSAGSINSDEPSKLRDEVKDVVKIDDKGFGTIQQQDSIERFKIKKKKRTRLPKI